MKMLLIASFLIFNTFLTQETLKPIFNGTDFEGWEVPEDNIWWSVNDGILHVENGPDLKGSILWTNKAYRDFVVEMDFLFGDGTIDTGIFLRKEQEQIQIGISGSLKRDMTCSPYIAGKGYPVEAEGVADLLKMDDWNTIKVLAKGNHYTAWLNGKEVMNYDSESAAEEGPIGLQLHAGKEMSVDFRNIKAGEL